MSWGLSLKSVFAFASVIIVLGCQPSSDDDKKHPFPTYDTTNEFEKEVEQASLRCDSSECESNKSDFESIGLIGMVIEGDANSYSRKIGRCTGFLYGSNDIVALNSHCISDSMWALRNDCGGVLAIKFPETPGKPSEVRRCVEILYKSDISARNQAWHSPDYAFFRIQPVNRSPLALSSVGISNGQTISVRKVNPIRSSSLDGVLDYARCRTQTDSLLNPDYKNEFSLTGLAVNAMGDKSCKAIRGNSGSPVLNSRNEIVGFLQSYAIESFISFLNSKEFKSAMKKSAKIGVEMDLPITLPEHFQFTQSVCARNPKNINEENMFCRSRAAPEQTDEQWATANLENVKSIEHYVSDLKSKHMPLFKDVFQYDMVKQKDRHVYSIQPTCLLPRTKWKANSIKEKINSRSTNSAESITTFDRPSVFDLKVSIKYDRNFVATSKILSHDTRMAAYFTTLDNNKLSSIFRIRASDDYSSYYLDHSDVHRQLDDISWCPN